MGSRRGNLELCVLSSSWMRCSPILPHLALREQSSLEPKEDHDRTARPVTLCGVSQCCVSIVTPKAWQMHSLESLRFGCRIKVLSRYLLCCPLVIMTQ